MTDAEYIAKAEAYRAKNGGHTVAFTEAAKLDLTALTPYQAAMNLNNTFRTVRVEFGHADGPRVIR